LASASPEEVEVVERYRESVESGMSGTEIDKIRQGIDSLVDQSLAVKF
jgi:hypothetical protein